MGLVRIIYYCIVVICLGISLFLTYFGFQKTLLAFTLPFTLVVGLVLFLADMLMQRNREAGRSLWLPALLFVVGAFFSTVSNFNFLYTNQMAGDVAAQTLRANFAYLRDDLVATRSHLNNLSAVREEISRRERIDQELNNAYSQASDPLNPGCGVRCRGHIDAINAQLTVPPTELRIPRSGPQLEAFFDTYRRLVFAAMDAEPRAAIFIEVQNLSSEIDQALTTYASPEAAAEGPGLSILAEMSSLSKDIERRANAILNPVISVDHTPIDPDAGQLGEIIYTLRNAFVEMPNFMATLISLIIAMVVDLLPIIVAVAAFRPGREGKKRRNQGQGYGPILGNEWGD